jgi:hypothetical protein
MLVRWPSQNQAEKKCLTVGEPTRNQSITMLMIVVKHDETLEPNLYLDTNQQKYMHVEIKGAD